MQSFREIYEAFDKPIEYDSDMWIKADSMMYHFKLDSNNFYRVVISRDPETKRKAYEVTFSHFTKEADIYNVVDNGKIDATNNLSTRNAISVFATVISIIKEFVRETPSATQINFTASLKEPSRVKLYRKLANMASKTMKWKAYEYEHQHPLYQQQQFVLSRVKLTLPPLEL